jgi:rare lipoprotein A (peptidoglycan hydrolase)
MAKTKSKKLKKLHRLVKKSVTKTRHLIKRILLRRNTKRLLRAFFVFVTTVCTGSLFLVVATTQPSIDPSLHSKFKLHSVSVDTNTGQIHAGGAADQTGSASWYALGLPSPDSLTCASRTFPRGSYLHVTSLRTKREVTCLVNDYGPEAWTGRVIDLSRGSFTQVDNLGAGTTPVEIRVVPAPDSSLNLNIPTTFGELSGYRLCETVFSAKYCEANRQQAVPLSKMLGNQK